MHMQRLKISTRLGVGFAIILLGMVLILALGGWLSTQNRRAMIDGMATASNKGVYAEEIKGSILEQALIIRNIGLQTDLAAIEKFKQNLKEKQKTYKENRELLLATNLNEEEKAVLAKVDSLYDLVDAPGKQAMKMMLEFNGEEAVKLITEKIDPLQQQTIQEINKLVELQKQENKRLVQDAEVKGHQILYLTFGVVGVITLGGIAFAVMLTRSITRPLRDAIAIAKRVAAGELTAQEAAEGHDEISELMRALKDMNDNLIRIVQQVRQGTDAIAVAASEISAGNSNLSQRTESQAGALEETASSMEEITATVKHNADNARQANHLVMTASDQASKGGDEVAKVVDTMNSIQESSRKIVDIISVIDSIAFQTNILALNAAVEAARAGEQGRGFAVVASEVRNLAQRSAGAAKEIKQLISDSVDKVQNGAKLVDGAGTTMKEIVRSVKHVADIMQEITAAGQEQSSGIEEVNRAITQMDEMTQQNAALVEQAAAAAESMDEQAVALAETVSAFKLSGQSSGPRRVSYQAQTSDNNEPGFLQKFMTWLGAKRHRYE